MEGFAGCGGMTCGCNDPGTSGLRVLGLRSSRLTTGWHEMVILNLQRRLG